MCMSGGQCLTTYMLLGMSLDPLSLSSGLMRNLLGSNPLKIDVPYYKGFAKF